MINELMLIAGNDIPFPGAGITIHQPTVKEIGYIGEEPFFIGLEMLKFNKNNLDGEDKVRLKDTDDFDILIAILREQNAVMKKNSICAQSLLSLLFPEHSIKILEAAIELKRDEELCLINKNNFEEFQKIIIQMFQFSKEEDSKSAINPQGKMAQKIADKLKKRHEKLSSLKGDQKIDILSRYISILSVALGKDINTIAQYTVYQLYDNFKRFELKMGYDIYLDAKMAGAKDLKEAQDWMQDIH